MGRIWTKLLIVLRGGTTDTGAVVVASQALRILDQELREAEEQMGVGHSSLANLMTKSILAAWEVRQTQERLAELTAQASGALEACQDELALEIASRIARLELLLLEDTRIAQEYSGSEERLRKALEVNESTLQVLKKQVAMVRTTGITQQVQACLSTSRREPAAQLQNVADALESLRDQQEQIAARLLAEEQRCQRDPEVEQGVGSAADTGVHYSAQVVLERIRSTGRSCAAASGQVQVVVPERVG